MSRPRPRPGRVALFSLLLALVFSASARAAGTPGSGFGLGVIVGSPTGVSAKYYLGEQMAIDAALGGAFLNRRGIHFHMDWLFHPLVLVSDEAFTLPVYVGLGGRLLQHSQDNDHSDLHIGARVPGGISFDFKTIPIDVFVEVALVIDIIRDHDGFTTDLNAGAGVRYYF